MYRIQALAEKAGVTVRTLHHYDRIGLLTPPCRSPAGYRLYDECAALRLQQILYYRELGLALDRISGIIDAPGFDAIAALERHRRELAGRIARLRTLEDTIDRTILHLKGELDMEKADIFSGFTPEEEAAYAAEAEKLYDPETVRASNRRWKEYGTARQKEIMEEGKLIYLDFAEAMDRGMKPESAEVQAITLRWRKNIEHFWTPRKDQLAPLARNYSADPRFRKTFEAIRPGLAEFVGRAVEVHVRK